MRVKATAIADVVEFVPARFADARGFFSATFSAGALAAAGIAEHDWVQDNHVLSAARGTVRGLHFQIPPAAQAKLVRVTRGAILDVAVDLRRASPTYGRHVAIEISAAAWNQVFVPKGFAHGYCTLEPETEVLYKVGHAYAPEHERGLDWRDPALGIVWPVSPADAVLSDRDRQWPRLADLPAWF
jgi:dTDP-4-dehydrorhamnose 3,5-epimerase